jgi:hypothetical protein
MPKGRGRGRVGGARPGGGGRGRGRGRGGGSVGKFLGPHTGKQAGAVANAQAGAEYNPEIRELRSQAKGSRQREGDLAQWYAQLSADYQGAQGAGAAALQSIQDTTGKQLAEAGDRSSADLAKLGADDEAFAKLTGGPKDTAGLSQIAQAGAAAERSRVALNVPVAQEQAHFVGRLGGEKSAARMRGIEARGEERDRREKIRLDLTAIRKDKGRARVGRKEEIRQADRGYVLDRKQLKLSQREAKAAEQQAAADAALAQIEAAQSARQDAIGNQQAQERIGISRRNAKTSARSQRATAKHYKQTGKDGGLSPSTKNTNKKERQNAAALVGSAVTQAGPPKTPAEAAELERLAVEAGGAPREVHRAVQNLLKKRKAKNRKGYAGRRKSIIGTVLHPGTTTR